MNEILQRISETQADLDEIYAWVRNNPDIQCYIYGAGLTIDSTVRDDTSENKWRPLTAPEVAVIVKTMAKGRPIGSVRKEAWGDTMSYTVRMGHNIGSITLQIERKSVCVRKVVGVKQVEVTDPDAPKVLKDQEVVEWDCIPVLANSESEALVSSVQTIPE